MITQQEYQTRRRELAMRLPANSIAIIPAANELLRNGDAHYRFRQDSHFYYLTGFQEPCALLLITAGSQSVSILFNRPRNQAQEQWSGKRLGQDDACRQLGVDSAFSIEEYATRLPELLAGKQFVYYLMGQNAQWEAHILQAFHLVKGQARKGVATPEAFCDLAPILGEMRLFKSQAEMALMQQAANITVLAHQRAMRIVQQAQFEYQLEAEILHELTRQGCRSSAYDSIVASGENACILHYTDNNGSLPQDGLVLIDAGAEYQNYAADVTRTFPVSGRFSTEQRLIYELVLSAQQAGIASIRPGCAWDTIQATIVKILTEGLIDLGLLKGSVDELIETQAYKLFYMHSSGHWLGLDVHDCGAYKTNNQWRTLQQDMVLTVEPGLYIPRDLAGVDKRWWGIGVRIEDDIAVTFDGFHNLTQQLASDVNTIEALIRG